MRLQQGQNLIMSEIWLNPIPLPCLVPTEGETNRDLAGLGPSTGILHRKLYDCMNAHMNMDCKHKQVKPVKNSFKPHLLNIGSKYLITTPHQLPKKNNLCKMMVPHILMLIQLSSWCSHEQKAANTAVWFKCQCISKDNRGHEEG